MSGLGKFRKNPHFSSQPGMTGGIGGPGSVTESLERETARAETPIFRTKNDFPKGTTS